MARTKWCRRKDLNPQPTDYKSVALPVELHRHKVWWRMTGSNRRPSACKADALPAELILHISRITALAWQRPTLTGGSPLLPSALKNLTSVFGMGTGVTSSPSLPDKCAYPVSRTFTIIHYILCRMQYFFERTFVHSKLDKTNIETQNNLTIL